MSGLPLGASTWCFNGLLPPHIKAVLDGAEPITCDNEAEIWDYFKELTSYLLESDIQAVELWYSSALHDGEVRDQLVRLSHDGKIASVHAPFGPCLDLSSPDHRVRRDGIAGCKMAANLVADLGGDRLVVHASALTEARDEVEGRLRLSAASIVEIADHADRLGIEIAVELLVRPNLAGTTDELEALLDTINRPNVGACIDVNHVFPQEELVPTIERLGSRILTLHVSDHDGEREQHWLPGKGVIDWAALAAALDRIGYDGPFIYEVRFDAPGIDEMLAEIESSFDAFIERSKAA